MGRREKESSPGTRRRRGVRRLLRFVFRVGLIAGAGAALRAAIGRGAGDSDDPSKPATPMSLDTWPPVPEAPTRREG